MTFLARFRRNDRGTAAAEFGFIAPIMCAGLISMATLGQAVYNRLDMQAAIRNGLQYWMNGGRDVAAVTTIVNNSWTKKPGNGAVTPAQIYMCGESVVTQSTTCSGGGAPTVYLQITASGTFTYAGFSETITMSNQARVR